MALLVNLNSRIINPASRRLDEDWIVAITEEINAMPETLSDVVEPELMGRYDAEMGAPCQPLRYYAKLGEIEAYIIGWKETTAILDELEDLRDGMENEEWIRRGGA
jgi:hypothetical protein